MAVPNAATFLGWTGKTTEGSVSGICDGLRAHTATPGIDQLYIVYKECEDWLKKNLSILFAKSGERQKEAGVKRLQGEVIDDLNGLMPGLGDALQGYQYKKGTSGVMGGKFASLGAGYANERKSYLASGKQQAPVSASRVHTMTTAMGTNFASLSVQDFERLGSDQALLRQHLNNGTVVRMYFLNKIQRLRLLATCDRQNPLGARWVDISGNLMSTKMEANNFLGEENVCQMWAMDRYGNLFVDYDNAGHGRYAMNLNANVVMGAIRSRGQTNHSSFCAGKDVICAGNIFLWKGQLLHIDNGSGHYAPNRQALYNAVSILWNAGAVLDYLRVGVQGGPNVATTFHKGTTFLQNGGADWRQQDWKADQDAIFRAVPGFQS